MVGNRIARVVVVVVELTARSESPRSARRFARTEQTNTTTVTHANNQHRADTNKKGATRACDQSRTWHRKGPPAE